MDTRQRFHRGAAIALAGCVALGVPAAALVREGSDLPPAKQALLDASAEMREAALRAPAPVKDPDALAPPRLPEPPWPTGIIESGQAPYPGSLYRFSNQWHEVVGGEHAIVYAGALREDPSQGIVAVAFTALDVTSPAAEGGVYETPVRAGAVRIVAATPDGLALEAADGTLLTFSLGSRTFAIV